MLGTIGFPTAGLWGHGDLCSKYETEDSKSAGLATEGTSIRKQQLALGLGQDSGVFLSWAGEFQRALQNHLQ